MPTFDSAGVPIHYESSGDGPPVVLVHGFASSLQGNWVLTGWLNRLVEAGRRVVALDCRGHGESAKPHDPDAYGAAEMSGDVLRLMDHEGIERADLMGYSMGGAISLNLLVHHGDRFRRAVLGGVGSQLTGPRRSADIASALTASDPAASSNPVARGFREFAESQGNDLEALAACMRRGRERLTPEELARIDVPVLIVVGERDDLVAGADELARAIPGARLIVVPDRDHLTVVPDHRYKEPALAFLAEE